MGQEQLVGQLDISKPGVSRALSALAAKGFVTRQPDPDDRRAPGRLTDKARDIGPQVEQLYNEVYALALQGISQEELISFLQLFGRMSENFTREQAENKQGLE